MVLRDCSALRSNPNHKNLKVLRSNTFKFLWFAIKNFSNPILKAEGTTKAFLPSKFCRFKMYRLG